jgi:hypothetical protein
MPELINIANELAASFIQTSDKKYAAKHIIHEINSLVHKESKEPVDYKLKLEIIKLMQEFISGRRPYKLNNDEIIITESKENINRLETIDYVLKQISVIHNQLANETTKE